MKKIESFLVLSIMMVSIIFLSRSLRNLDSIFKERESLVGENITLVNDTLMIVDWDFVFDKYELSNGASIDADLATKKLLK